MYWTDIFTETTWRQAAAAGFRVTGFPRPTPGWGGYTNYLLEKVSKDDILLCYCKSPAMAWVGALRVVSTVQLEDEPLWGWTDTGEVRFPSRFRTEPLVALPPSHGVPAKDVLSRLGFLREFGSRWGSYLQRSLNSVPDSDGKLLVSLMRRRKAGVTGSAVDLSGSWST